MSWLVSPNFSTVSRVLPESSLMELALTNVLFAPPENERLTPSLTTMLPKKFAWPLTMSTWPGSRPGLTSIFAPLPLSIIAEARSFSVEPAEPERLAESVPALFCRMAKVPPLPMKTSFWPRPCTFAMNVPPWISV